MTGGNSMIRRLLSSQLRINMASGVAATIINMAVLAVGYPVYLHFLGYETYGVWLVLATVLSVAQLGELGVSRAVMKLVAEEYGRGDIQALQEYVMTAIAILIAAGVVVLTVIVAFRAQIAGAFRLTAENAEKVLWLLPYIACLSIYVFIVQALNATLSGLGRMDLANWAQSAGRIVRVSAAIPLLYSGRGIESLLIANGLSYALIHIVSIALIWRVARIRLFRIRNLNRQRGRRLLSFGLTLCGGSLINMLLSPFNKLMLSRYAGVSAIPVYEIAYRGSMQLRGLLETGLRALMPEVSRFSAQLNERTREGIARLNRAGTKLIAFAGAPLFAVVILLSPVLFRIWLGDRFVEALPGAFSIVAVGTFLSLLGVPAFYTLIGLGRPECALFAHAVQSGVNLLILLTWVFLAGDLSVNIVVSSVTVSMFGATAYLLWQKKRTLSRLRWPCVPQTFQAEPQCIA